MSPTLNKLNPEVILRCALSMTARRSSKNQLWTLVRVICGTGYGTATKICQELDWDPNSVVGKKTFQDEVFPSHADFEEINRSELAKIEKEREEMAAAKTAFTEQLNDLTSRLEASEKQRDTLESNFSFAKRKAQRIITYALEQGFVVLVRDAGEFGEYHLEKVVGNPIVGEDGQHRYDEVFVLNGKYAIQGIIEALLAGTNFDWVINGEEAP